MKRASKSSAARSVRLVAALALAGLLPKSA